eukprot:TRINITY_DN6643_c0_g1_i2.p1 TRINITY_DN6643_c0_g1~~TRINITY_DN6643_c0_g1_i2.p1  ORF type:complete len:137 (-),score=15.13 TRINITY_DN6643_c0_g1_i2:99-509(-)
MPRHPKGEHPEMDKELFLPFQDMHFTGARCSRYVYRSRLIRRDRPRIRSLDRLHPFASAQGTRRARAEPGLDAVQMERVVAGPILYRTLITRNFACGTTPIDLSFADAARIVIHFPLPICDGLPAAFASSVKISPA